MSTKDTLKAEPYRVLARKYRPQNFDELIGQDALVRTLKNAIETGRIAHAFMLTGVRGVGKTTTARIIAKALNYKGADGTAGPTTGDTSDCQLCQAISEDRHPDIMEMDAASRTGVDDIREILDGVRYAPTEARYKIYIIDEVHMLSKNAFNALLKTLEEPPEHVKFIFATTEIRKVPITVLSRCQRFDLRRVDVPTLSSHYASICQQENVKAQEEAIAMIARAADGSVRDGLSLLDQAIALSGQEITAQLVKDMLGLADRAKTLDLLERALTGNIAEALEIMDDLYKSGADPVVLVQDLLGLTHILTRLRAVPKAREMNYAMAAAEIERAAALAGELSMPTLSKCWQLLLKGLAEVQAAPNSQSAAEMVIMRLSYAADLPDPSDLIKMLESGDGAGSAGSASSGRSAGSSVAAQTTSQSAAAQSSSTDKDYVKSNEGGGVTASREGSGGSHDNAVRGTRRSNVELAVVPQREEAPEDHPLTIQPIKTLEDVVQVLNAADEPLLAGQVFQSAHLVKLEEGRIEFRPAEYAPPKLAQDLGAALSRVTGTRWMVSVSGAPGQPTLAEKAENVRAEEYANVLQMPVIQDIMKVFPEAKLVDIQTVEKE